MDEVKLSNSLMHTVMNTVGTIVLVLDTQGKIIYVNQACQDASLYEQSELIGKHIWDFSPSHEISVLQNFLSNILKNPGLSRIETSWISKYENVRVMDWSVNVQFGEDAIVSNVIFSGIDVTEKNAAIQTTKDDAQVLHDTLVETISAVATTIEKRDPYTAGHQHRVSDLSVAIGEMLELSLERIEGLKLGSMIHDIGKIYIPSEILNRPGRLTKHEFGMITTHPEVGFDIIKDVTFPWPIKEMIVQHHERLDGTGYPAGLSDKDIILEAKIIAVADVVEAITSHRPYRPALGLDFALKILDEGRGKSFDSNIVDICIKVLDEKKVDWRQNSGQSEMTLT